MNRKTLGVLLLFIVSVMLSSEPVSLDRVIAVVNDKPLLSSAYEKEVSYVISSASAAKGLNIDSVRNEILQQMIDDIIVDEIVKEESIKIDSSLIMKDAQNKLDDLRSTNFPDSSAFQEFLKTSKITENELRDIYFKQINGIVIRQQIIGRKGITMIVEENDLKSFYEEKKDSFIVPMNFDLYHMAFVIQPDTTAMFSAMQKMESLVQYLKAGTDFAQVAKEYSDDKSSKNGGMMSFKKYSELNQDIASFLFYNKKADTLLYTQTKDGYRIIKVIKADADSVKYQQILVKIEVTKEDSSTARRKADSALAKLKSGKNFEILAKELSDDYSTREQGGFIAKVSAEMLGEEIKDKILKLNDSEYTGILPSDFGYEIFMIKHKVGGYTSAYEDVRDLIKNIIETRRLEFEIGMLVKEKRAKSYIRIIG